MSMPTLLNGTMVMGIGCSAPPLVGCDLDAAGTFYRLRSIVAPGQ